MPSVDEQADPTPPDVFERDSVLHEAIAQSGIEITLERVLAEEPRLPVLELYLAHYRAHQGDLLVPHAVLRGRHVGRLATRMRLRAALASQPEASRRPIERPLFVTGLPRTGTTLLYNLLALQDGVRAPRMWELESPAPAPRPEAMDDDPRIAAVEQALAYIDQLVPDLRRIHALAARAPEECTFLMRQDYAEEDVLFSREIPAVAEWLEAQDFRQFYQYHRSALQLLGRHFPADLRWVLKSPFHLFHLPSLWSTYPDAELVFTHRRPAETVSSALSLFSLPQRTWRTFDPVAQASSMLDRLAAGWDRAIADRDRAQADGDRSPPYDCRYEDLMADPIGTVRAIESHFGRSVSPEAEARMRAFVADNPKDKHGKHQHSLDRFGLTEADVERAFAAYLARYPVPQG